MPYTAQFFSEKLNVPVEYFNPFRNVQIDPSLNLEELAKVAHSLGEVVGLGLRNLAHCPVELNLMPKSSIRKKELDRKKPYLIASVFCLVLVVFAFGWFYDKVSDDKQAALEALKGKVEPLDRNKQSIDREIAALKGAEADLEAYTAIIEDRFYWGGLLSSVRDALMAVENSTGQQKTGVWIEKLIPYGTAGAVFHGSGPEGGLSLKDLYSAAPTNRLAGPIKPKRFAPRTQPGATTAPSEEKELLAVVMHCRAVNMASTDPAGTTKLAAAVAEELKTKTSYFDPALR